MLSPHIIYRALTRLARKRGGGLCILALLHSLLMALVDFLWRFAQLFLLCFYMEAWEG